jgi:hypothetical protein
MAKAVRPPLEVAPAAIKAAFARQTGHIALLLPFLARSLGRLFQIRGQAIERSFPELAILLHPLGRLFERFGLELHFVHTPVTPAAKQSRLLKNAQMFRYRWQRHVMRPSQMRDAFIAAGKMREDAPPRRVGQSGECAIQNLWRIFNHLVNYLPKK